MADLTCANLRSSMGTEENRDARYLASTRQVRGMTARLAVDDSYDRADTVPASVLTFYGELARPGEGCASLCAQNASIAQATRAYSTLTSCAVALEAIGTVAAITVNSGSEYSAEFNAARTAEALRMRDAAAAFKRAVSEHADVRAPGPTVIPGAHDQAMAAAGFLLDWLTGSSLKSAIDALDGAAGGSGGASQAWRDRAVTRAGDLVLRACDEIGRTPRQAQLVEHIERCARGGSADSAIGVLMTRLPPRVRSSFVARVGTVVIHRKLITLVTSPAEAAELARSLRDKFKEHATDLPRDFHQAFDDAFGVGAGAAMADEAAIRALQRTSRGGMILGFVSALNALIAVSLSTQRAGDDTRREADRWISGAEGAVRLADGAVSALALWNGSRVTSCSTPAFVQRVADTQKVLDSAGRAIGFAGVAIALLRAGDNIYLGVRDGEAIAVIAGGMEVATAGLVALSLFTGNPVIIGVAAAVNLVSTLISAAAGQAARDAADAFARILLRAIEDETPADDLPPFVEHGNLAGPLRELDDAIDANRWWMMRTRHDGGRTGRHILGEAGLAPYLDSLERDG